MPIESPLSLHCVQISKQLSTNNGVAQAAQCLSLNLPHALTGHAHLFANLLQRVLLPVQQPVPQLQDMHFSGRQGLENYLKVFPQQIEDSDVVWRRGSFILDEIPHQQVPVMVGRRF